jgi:hypothetical protein
MANRYRIAVGASTLGPDDLTSSVYWSDRIRCGGCLPGPELFLHPPIYGWCALKWLKDNSYA